MSDLWKLWQKLGWETASKIGPTSFPVDNSSGSPLPVPLSTAPLLLLADEPTGALDTHTTDEVLQIFEELHSTGITVVMVTHEPDVARTSQRIIWFRDGEVVNDRLSPEDLGSMTAVVR